MWYIYQAWFSACRSRLVLDQIIVEMVLAEKYMIKSNKIAFLVKHHKIKCLFIGISLWVGVPDRD